MSAKRKHSACTVKEKLQELLGASKLEKIAFKIGLESMTMATKGYSVTGDIVSMVSGNEQ